MKLTKKFLESLIREAMEEANCRGNELGEMNCAGKRDDGVLEEKEKEGKKEHPLDVDGDGEVSGDDFEKMRKNKKLRKKK